MKLLPAFVGMPERNRVYNVDALTLLKATASGSVDCVVTSPPYFGLRDYGVDGQIGLEPTPREFVDALVAVFREARRVLKDTGTCWINLGDSYNSSPKGKNPGGFQGAAMRRNSGYDTAQPRKDNGLPEKSLLGIPWRVAFALQDDGWILRSDIIWHKPNPMPESVTDRPTKSHEYVFLLAKSARYWYDADAIREPQKEESIERVTRGWNGNGERGYPNGPQNHIKDYMGKSREEAYALPGRNRRSVWTVATEPTPFAHFATFPQKLIEPMILAGCPDKACAVCGKPWVRGVERGEMIYRSSSRRPVNRKKTDDADYSAWSRPGGLGATQIPNASYERIDKGFEPTCTCNGETRPGIVLDPFMGSGTTGLVARRLGRDYIGSDISAEYVAIARERLRQPYEQHYVTRESAPMADLPLFADARNGLIGND